MERITFLRENAWRPESVLIKKQRTWEQTRQQFSRLIKYEPDGHMMNRIMEIFHKTEYALEADERIPRYIIRAGVKLIKKEELSSPG